MREYKTLKALRRGYLVEVDGFIVRKIDGMICIDDPYVAERNTGPKLLTAREVVMIDDELINFIHSNEVAYSFNGYECVRVELLDTVGE